MATTMNWYLKIPHNASLLTEELQKEMIGKLVYESYTPQNPGIILAYLGREKALGPVRYQYHLVRVLWLKKKEGRGDVSITAIDWLSSLDAHIADTARKLSGHKERKEELLKKQIANARRKEQNED